MHLHKFYRLLCKANFKYDAFLLSIHLLSIKRSNHTDIA